MAFLNQPLTLRIRAKVGKSVEPERAFLIVRYALLKEEKVAWKPHVREVLRAGRVPLIDPKQAALWTVEEFQKEELVGNDGARSKLLKLTFRGDEFAKRLAAGKSREDRDLFAAIVDQATVELDLELGAGSNEEYPELSQLLACLSLRLEPVFYE